MKQLILFGNMLKSSGRDLLPIIAVIAFFQTFILQSMPDNLLSIVIGLTIVLFGLAIFIQGLEIGIFPIGENLANEFAKKGSLFWVLFFAFLIGFSTTVAEPALIVIGDKAAEISQGKVDAFGLRMVVALSVGFAIVLGVLRIFLGHPIHLYIITGYILVVAVTSIAPKEIVGLAYDSGGVTTSTVTVPLVAALGVGLASSIKGRNPVIDGFGLIAFASLTPMIFVQLYGVVVYAIAEPTSAELIKSTQDTLSEVAIDRFGFESLILEFASIVKDVTPIVLILFGFQYLVIKKHIAYLGRTLIGLGMVVVGLFAFVIGLELGLFSLGETMAFQLIENGNLFWVYTFGFLIGFSITMAEPALIVVALKVKEISSGRINDLILRLFVALGVAFGISLGAYRIVQGDPIHYYIIAGYLVVIVLTYISPRYIIPIAYDSGGVTTSTVTVPLVAALGLGLASNIDGRSVLIDGFGLIAFASLFPMITVMSYGILSERFLNRKKEIKE